LWVGTTLFTYILPDHPTAQTVALSTEPLPAPPRSPAQSHLPLLTASQGPPDWTASPFLLYKDGQFIFSLSPPDNNGVCDKIPFCRVCQVHGHNKATCPVSKCYFCAEAHSAFSCSTPHCCCTNNHYWVPLSHSNHGWACPAQISNIDMTKVKEANCNYCNNLLNAETSMAASF